MHDIGDISGSSGQKDTDLQFSREVCYEKGASANLGRLAAVWAEMWATLEK